MLCGASGTHSDVNVQWQKDVKCKGNLQKRASRNADPATDESLTAAVCGGYPGRVSESLLLAVCL